MCLTLKKMKRSDLDKFNGSGSDKSYNESDLH